MIHYGCDRITAEEDSGCERNGDLLAIYNYYPTSPAQPSQIDIDMASYPDALNFIISLNTKGILELRGFMLGNNSAKEMSLVLEQ